MPALPAVVHTRSLGSAAVPAQETETSISGSFPATRYPHISCMALIRSMNPSSHLRCSEVE